MAANAKTHNKTFILVVSALCLALFAWSCRNNKKAGTLSLIPERIENVSDATAANRWGPNKPVNLHTQTLFVQLDYLPEPRVGAASIPVCLAWLPDDFALGQAQCDPSSSKVEILPAHVRQSCLAGEDTREPSVNLQDILNCDFADVFSYQFNPSLTFGVSGPTAK